MASNENTARISERSTRKHSSQIQTAVDDSTVSLLDLQITAEHSRKVNNIKKMYKAGEYEVPLHKVAKAIVSDF